MGTRHFRGVTTYWSIVWIKGTKLLHITTHPRSEWPDPELVTTDTADTALPEGPAEETTPSVYFPFEIVHKKSHKYCPLTCQIRLSDFLAR